MSNEDLKAELAELTRQARAWVQWAADSGADNLDTRTDPRALLASLRDGAPQARRQGQAAPERSRPQPYATATRAPDPDRPVAAAAAPAAALPSEERGKRLTLLQEQVRSCTTCRLHEERTQTVFARGNPGAELMFIGEGPGRDEDLQGYPFVGKAGQLLDKMIVAMGYQPHDVYIANIVKCRPPNNRKPEPDEMAACVPYLREQIALVNPKVMVALGATGVQGLLGTTQGITRMRGQWKLYQGKIPLMPTFHPAYLLRQPEKKREVWSDLQEVMKRLGKEVPSPRDKGGPSR